MRYSDFSHMKWYDYFTIYELSSESSLGLPFLSCEGKDVKLTFFPHIIRYKDGYVKVYRAEGKICMNYPFEHIESFTRYHIDATEPVCSIKAELLAGKGRNAINELYIRLDDILEKYSSLQCNISDDVDSYQAHFKRVLDMLGLHRVYKGTGR